MASRLVAAVVVRDGLLGGWWSVEGGAGSRGGWGCHKARDSIDDAVRGGGGHGRADEDVSGALASGKQVDADDSEAVAESSNYGARARAGGTCLVAVLHAASVIGCWGCSTGAASHQQMTLAVCNTATRHVPPALALVP